MSKMSDMTEYHASAYRLPSGFEHCSKLKPMVEAGYGAGPGQGRGGRAVFAGRLPVGR